MNVFIKKSVKKKQSKLKGILASATTMLGLTEIEDENFGRDKKRKVREPIESLESNSEFEWSEEEILRTWGYHGFEEIAWNDKDKPFARLREYEDITLG